MIKRVIILSFFSLLTSLVILSCKKDNISAADSKNSHHAGENCMSCHFKGGSGKGSFIIAGTVYNASKTAIVENPIIYIFTQPNGGGDLLVTINGDLNGNFYTTQSYDLSSGIYPAVTKFGELKYMITPTTVGACNSCHGSSTSKISVY